MTSKNLKKILSQKHFEQKVDLKNTTDELTEEFLIKRKDMERTQKVLPVKVWEQQKTFKDDDRKLRKQIKGEYNQLKSQIEERLVKYNVDNVKTDELLLSYFNELKEEVSNLPEVKYYDKDMKNFRVKLKFKSDVTALIGDIKTLYCY